MHTNALSPPHKCIAAHPRHSKATTEGCSLGHKMSNDLPEILAGHDCLTYITHLFVVRPLTEA